MNRYVILLLSVLLVSILAALCPADGSAAPATRIVSAGIEGTLLICGGGTLPAEAVAAFAEAVGGKNARLVVVSTASDAADNETGESFRDVWKDHGFASVTLLHTRSRKEANQEEFLAPLREADAVWFDGGSQARLSAAFVGTRFEEELYALLTRGGGVGGTSAGAAVMSRLMIAGGNPQAESGVGFDLLPDAIIDLHFTQRNRKSRLVAVLEQNPGHFGLGIDEGTAVVVKGRRMRVVGDATATICLSASRHRDSREMVLRAGQVVDLTALRRAARDRAAAPFPSSKPEPANVKNGSLLIVGGGALSEEMLRRFIELAGGPDAPIVIIPTADADPLPRHDRVVQTFHRAGARDVRELHGRNLEEVEAPAFLDTLRNARGVWFGGGRQWRLVDAYAGTVAEELFHEVLRRGGVIGGSSAGASIQAEYLVRGHPLGNTEIMAEGYERGFGFLPGVAIDQHFAQRQRFADLESVVRAWPQLLGIGIDEATAVVVRGSVAQVLGKHDVHFYHTSPVAQEQLPVHDVVGAGGRYHLGERKILN